MAMIRQALDVSAAMPPMHTTGVSLPPTVSTALA
jgi:hypothetical protein